MSRSLLPLLVGLTACACGTTPDSDVTSVQVEVPGDRFTDVVPLEHANAEDVASVLEELFRPIPWWSRGCAVPIYGQEREMDRFSREPECQRVQVVVLPRTNSLALSAESAVDLARVIELVARLDGAARSR